MAQSTRSKTSKEIIDNHSKSHNTQTVNRYKDNDYQSQQSMETTINI